MKFSTLWGVCFWLVVTVFFGAYAWQRGYNSGVADGWTSAVSTHYSLDRLFTDTPS